MMRLKRIEPHMRFDFDLNRNWIYETSAPRDMGKPLPIQS